MAAPTYVAKKVGDQYVVVPKNPPATADGSMWLAGGVLVTGMGLLKRGPSGLLLTVLGASAICRGVTGRNPWKMLINDLCPDCLDGAANQSVSFQNDVIPSKQVPQDEIDEASMESFPASDPPARHAATSA
jgi:hypothetical protein